MLHCAGPGHRNEPQQPLRRPSEQVAGVQRKREADHAVSWRAYCS